MSPSRWLDILTVVALVEIVIFLTVFFAVGIVELLGLL